MPFLETMPTAIHQLSRTDRRLSVRLLMRVAAGAALLDQVEPDWYRRIALDELGMETCDRCILGQLHGDFLAGFWAITRPLPSHHLFSAAEHGFTLSDEEQRYETEWEHDRASLRFAALADAWRFQVRLRQRGDHG